MGGVTMISLFVSSCGTIVAVPLGAAEAQNLNPGTNNQGRQATPGNQGLIGIPPLQSCLVGTKSGADFRLRKRMRRVRRAVKRRPGKLITLRQEARVIKSSR